MGTDELMGSPHPVGYDDQFRIYALVAPSRILNESESVNRAVAAALGIQPSAAHRISLSDASAWLDYAAVGELWDRPQSPILPEREEAQIIAERALRALEHQCSDTGDRRPQSLRGISLLPPISLLQPAGLHAVPRPDRSAWDHWLYRAEPRLVLDGGGKMTVGVFGAHIEVRIGHAGRVVGIRSRWRPLSGERRFSEPTAYQPEEPDDDHEGPHYTNQAPPPLFYVLDGDGIPQHYLAPYYFAASEDHLAISSASAWSLTVDIGRTSQSDDRMTLTALAQGGSGDYAYRWASHRLDDFFDGFRQLGAGATQVLPGKSGSVTASSIEVGNGHYVVMVNVKDRRTGAFKHHQQQIFSAPFPAQAS